MKTLNIISIGLACTFALACTVEKPENPVAETPAGYIVLKASAPSTKTVLDGVAVNWTSSDAIVVNGNTSTAITVGSDASSADFTIPATEAPFYAISPASAYVDGSFNLSTGVLGSVTLPATQTYVAGSYDPAVAVMTGYQASETAGIAFEHAMAYLRFVVEGTTDTDAIKSLAVTSGAEPLCGTFTLNSSGISVANPGTTVTMDCGEGVAQGNPIIVAIPAGTYSKGLTVTAMDVNGHSASVVSSKSFTAAAGTIYPTTIPFAPAADDAIMNAEQWAAFAKQVADGDDFAGKTVKIGADITVDEYFEYANGVFNGTLEGNNHVMTANGNMWPLFATIGENGKVQNLTVGGSFAAMANPGVAGNATIAKINKGTIYKCTSTATTDLTITGSGCIFGAICGQNGGVVEDCKNTGDIIINFAMTGDGATYGGGISALGHTVLGGSTNTTLDVDETCIAGQFINCTNEGSISLTVSGGYIPTKNAVGGICGLVYMDGTSFKSCVNKGSISRISDGEKSNKGSASVGGILGRAAAWATASNTQIAIDNGDVNGYATTYTNCSNSGTLLCQTRHSGCIIKANETGARLDAVGGIVGAAIGKGENVQAFTGCSNTGTISGGWSKDTNTTVFGGIAGLANVTNIVDCTVNATFKALDASHPIGAAGGFVGFARKDVNVSGTSSAKSVMDLYVRVTSKPEYNLLYYGLAFGDVVTSATVSASVGGSIKVDGTDLGVSSENYLEYIVSSGSNFTPSLDNVLWAE